ncbi:MAG: hypothetical protein HOW73_09745 [Polyangiaceae bacterium]|nr:hypothetical protein [Polyangiaceae bacterium]
MFRSFRALLKPTTAVATLLVAPAAHAATYQVGPDKEYASLDEVIGLLAPGDVVEVDGGATYGGDLHIRPENSGTPDSKITIRGIRVNGQRPIIEGGAEYGVVLHASHFVFEGFEVTGASSACLIHKADDVTIRDVVVHDCPNHGILGTDFESGSLTIEYSEFYGNGQGEYEHQIYIATDETMYPGSVFRLQHSYVHDGNGGNNVKTRAERNEIYCNWIENPAYHVIDLVPPDGQDPSLAREDADVVGNVLIQPGQWYISRMGSDKEEYGTDGRFRFAYNTIVSNSNASAFFRLQWGIESASFYDNVFMTSDGGSLELVNGDDAWWTSGEQLTGKANFVAAGLESPGSFEGSVTGGDPGFVDGYIPGDGSALLNLGVEGAGPSGFEVPNAWSVPNCVPPNGTKNEAMEPFGRPVDGVPDLGAFELGTTFEPGPGPGPGPGTDDDGNGDGDGDGNGGGSSDGGDDDDGCNAGSSSHAPRGGLIALVALAGFVALRRRRP